MKKQWKNFYNFLLRRPKTLRFFLSLFACSLLFLFGLGGPANASWGDGLDKEISNDYCDSYYGNTIYGQSITPTSDFNLQEVWWGSVPQYNWGYQPDQIYVCELTDPTSLKSSGDCVSSAIGTLSLGGGVGTYYPNSGAGWNYYVINGSLTLHSGHYYEVANNAGTVLYSCSSGSNHYAGGQNNQGSSYDAMFRIYGTPSTYCGDGICNGTETNATCAGDCPPTGKIYWAGVGSQFGQIGGYWDIPVYYNFCADYDLIKQAYLTIGASFTDGYTQVLYDKSTFIGPQKCSGIAMITSRVKQTTPYTGNMGINLVMVPYGLTDPVNEADLPIATTTMSVVISTGQSSVNYLDFVMDNPLTISTSAGTTTQTFAYNFDNLAWSGGQVCLFNSITSFKTGYCQNITTSSGTSTIDFPNVNLPTQLKGEYILYSSTTIPIYRSSSFVVNWVVPTKPGEIVCNPPTLDLSHSCDNFDTSGSGFSMGNLACGVVQAVQVAGFKAFVPGCGSLSVFNEEFGVFKHAFPFNAFFDLTTSIDTAIASSTASATSTIGIPFINRNATTTNKFYILPIVSSSSMATSLGTANNNTFRSTLGFVMWIFGAVIVYFTIRKI